MSAINHCRILLLTYTWQFLSFYAKTGEKVKGLYAIQVRMAVHLVWIGGGRGWGEFPEAPVCLAYATKFLHNLTMFFRLKLVNIGGGGKASLR